MKVVESRASRSIGGFLAIQGLRYLAASQSFAMVVFHAGWILLALATWGHASGPDSDISAATRALVRAYAWLGGVDAGGRGDANSLMTVWAKLALVIYIVEALWRRLSGRREPLTLWRIAVVSWFVAQLGYVGALIPTGDLGEATWMVIAFPILAGLATAWSVAAHRLAKGVEVRISKMGSEDRPVNASAR